MLAKTILILAANPANSTQLQLDEEVREISEGLQSAQQRSTFVLKQRWAVRPRDLQRAMLEEKPWIAHFSGYGDGEDSLLLKQDDGSSQTVNGATLTSLFKLFKETRCVVLNACYSEEQAHAIAEHIDYVVGMRREIGDRTALAFSVAFYDALGAGKELDFAFDLACNEVHLTGTDEKPAPLLIKRPGATPFALEETGPPIQKSPFRWWQRLLAAAGLLFFLYALGKLTWQGFGIRPDNPTMGPKVTLQQHCPKVKLEQANVLYKQACAAIKPDGSPQCTQDGLRRVLKICPEHPEANNNLGNAYEHMGNDIKAAEYYRKAVEAAPDFWQAWLNLGGTWNRLQRGDLALAAYARICGQHPPAAEKARALLQRQSVYQEETKILLTACGLL